jgi:hypothetical protein
MEKLRPVRRKVEVKPLRLQVAAKALVTFLAEQIAHRPIARREIRHGEWRVTLTAMWREVYGQGATLLKG